MRKYTFFVLGIIFFLAATCAPARPSYPRRTIHPCAPPTQFHDKVIGEKLVIFVEVWGMYLAAEKSYCSGSSLDVEYFLREKDLFFEIKGVERFPECFDSGYPKFLYNLFEKLSPGDYMLRIRYKTYEDRYLLILEKNNDLYITCLHAEFSQIVPP